MLAHSRAKRLIAGFGIVLLAIPLVLSTPWVKSIVLEQASTWAGGRFGVDVRAARLDYRLTSLTFVLDDVAVAGPATPDRPFIRIAHAEIDLAASALRGRLDFDRIRLLQPSVVLDATTRPGRPAAAREPSPGATPTPFPLFEVGSLEIEGLDVVVSDEDDLRVAVHQITSTLHGRGPQRLEGEITAAGGVDVTFGTDVVHVAFDRAKARIVVDGSRRIVTGALTAFSQVSELRAEGDVPLDRVGNLNLRYDATGQLGELRTLVANAPEDWTGRATLQGQVRGVLARPEATFAVKSADLDWPPLANATLDAAGRRVGRRSRGGSAGGGVTAGLDRGTRTAGLQSMRGAAR